MWHALRAELAYFRPFLLFAWAIAAAIGVLINGLTLLGSEGGHPPLEVMAGLPGIFFVIAAMVVGFIAQGTRSEERRARLLLAGPLTPPRMAAVMVLLPACLLGMGALAAAAALALGVALTGQAGATPVFMVVGVAAQMFAIVQLGPLAQESSAAYRQRRVGASGVGWTVFVGSILLLAGLHVLSVRWLIYSGELMVAVAAMVVSSILFSARTDFTR